MCAYGEVHRTGCNCLVQVTNTKQQATSAHLLEQLWPERLRHCLSKAKHDTLHSAQAYECLAAYKQCMVLVLWQCSSPSIGQVASGFTCEGS